MPPFAAPTKWAGTCGRDEPGRSQAPVVSRMARISEAEERRPQHHPGADATRSRRLTVRRKEQRELFVDLFSPGKGRSRGGLALGLLILLIYLVASLLPSPRLPSKEGRSWVQMPSPSSRRRLIFAQHLRRTTGNSIRSTYHKRPRATARSRASPWRSTSCLDCQAAPKTRSSHQSLLLTKIGDTGWVKKISEGGSGVTFAEFVSVVKGSLASLPASRSCR